MGASNADDIQRLESLISQLLKQKPDITRNVVNGLIEEKKSKVGGGYLTDQGALFLVASDLGIALSYSHTNSTKLANIAPDMPSLTVLGRILSFGPRRVSRAKQIQKQGVLSRMMIYDDSSTIAVSLWDSKASIALSGIRPGDAIKISNGYSRMGFDGSLTLNVAEKGNIEKISDEDSAEIPPIATRAVPPELVIEPAKFLVVKGKIRGQPRQTSFSRSDGSTGNLVSFGITSASPESSEGNSTEMRAVVWDNANPSFQSLRDGEEVTLLNVKSKPGRQPGETLEIHGDETTFILEYVEETLQWIKKNAEGVFDVSDVSSSGPQATILKKSIQNKASDPIPFVARVLSVGQKSQDGSTVRMLLVDSQKRKLSITASKDSVEEASAVSIEDVIVCKPDSVDYLGFKASCSRKGSIMKTSAKREDIPRSSSLVTKIEKLEDPSIISLEVMSLAESVSREVQTKDGLVRRSELQVGDATGEIRLFAWRDLSKMLEKIPAGEHLLLHGVEVQSYEGKKFLNLKNYSMIVRNQQ